MNHIRSIHVKYAIKMLEKEPTITMPNILNKLKIKFTDCNISIRHLTRVVRENTCDEFDSDEFDSDEFDDGTWNDKGVDQKVYCLISTCIISCIIMILILLHNI